MNIWSEKLEKHRLEPRPPSHRAEPHIMLFSHAFGRETGGAAFNTLTFKRKVIGLPCKRVPDASGHGDFPAEGRIWTYGRESPPWFLLSSTR